MEKPLSESGCSVQREAQMAALGRCKRVHTNPGELEGWADYIRKHIRVLLCALEPQTCQPHPSDSLIAHSY